MQNYLNCRSTGARALLTLVLFTAGGCLVVKAASFRPEATSTASQRTLTFGDRVAYQRAVEEVYWQHRIWPKENFNPKPSLNAVMSETQLEKKVADYLRKSEALDDSWQRPITAEQLQAEIDRMAKHTKQPEVLREVFQALGNDPYVIAECFAKPAVVERLLTTSAAEQPKQAVATDRQSVAAYVDYRLPAISAGAACVDNTWTATTILSAPDRRAFHTAVWTEPK